MAAIKSWLSSIQSHSSTNLRDDPNYYASKASTLITTSQPLKFNIGTGRQILSDILSSCLSTEHELIIVTCFWAKSTSQEAVSTLLRKLSAKALSQDRKIRVRLCFSSSSITQKLSHTSSIDGKIYPPSSWTSLGLPLAEEVVGLEMVVKSVFVRPFSVMHPKFILMDRERAFVPSCNVSWEEWLEGCVEMKGEITRKLFEFWTAFWGREGAELPPLLEHAEAGLISAPASASSLFPKKTLIDQTIFSEEEVPTPTILLPSPHHRNPYFRPLGFSDPIPPPTPLNTFLLHIFNHAKTSIFIQTPNLTCAPVVKALLSAVQRGVDAHIITCRRLMILEQIVTAGTITEYEIWKLRRQYRLLLGKYEKMSISDPEASMREPGRLNIGYFVSKEGDGDDEPLKSHLKLTIVDEEITVLGSGNMDRASWFTSQELGVAFFSTIMAGKVRGCVNQALEGRIDYVC